jgi:hypothetical protein
MLPGVNFVLTVTDPQATKVDVGIAAVTDTLQIALVGLGVVIAELNAARGMVAEGAFSPIVEGGGLTAHELAGGHTLARHVGLDAAALDARGVDIASTFLTRAEAEAAGSAALSQNAVQVSSWLQAGAATNLRITTPFTGGLVRVAGGYEASATSATFILKGNGSGGFFILTGFPTP